MQVYLKSAEATQEVARLLANHLQDQTIILLDGQLGAGKTTFTKGLASGLGITEMIKSPTYTLVRDYMQGRLPLYHFDVYRLEDTGAEGLGFEEYLDSQSVCVIEWSQFIQDLLPNDYLRICLAYDADNADGRCLAVQAHGEKYQQLWQAWQADLEDYQDERNN